MASSPVRRAPAGRSVWVLVALLTTVVGAAVAYQLMRTSANGPARTSNEAGAERSARAEAPPEAPPPDVRLSALGTQAAELADAARNPFRLGSTTPTGPAPGAVARPVPAPVSPPVSTPMPGSPAIPLKFIGVVEAPGVGKIAALTDGTFVFHGREGEIIDGRYRIVSIGVESLVVERVDGTGRQTLRLTG